jgi:hypothetical protein
MGLLEDTHVLPDFPHRTAFYRPLSRGWMNTGQLTLQQAAPQTAPSTLQLTPVLEQLYWVATAAVAAVKAAAAATVAAATVAAAWRFLASRLQLAMAVAMRCHPYPVNPVSTLMVLSLVILQQKFHRLRKAFTTLTQTLALSS